jgi:uncharacterized membrane protein
MDQGVRSIEARIAHILMIGTLVAVALLAIGCVLLLASGRSPLDPYPPLDLGHLAADIGTLQPGGVLWVGLIAVIVTPAARVVAALVGYARSGERGMTVVAALILVVIAVGVVAGTVGG